MGQVKCKPVGPADAKIVIVGESPSEHEIKSGVLFSGTSGDELTRLLGEAGIDRAECYLTSVFKHRPPNGSLENYCVSKKDLPLDYSYPYLYYGKYIAPKYLTDVEETKNELKALSPNLIIALGSTASWFFNLGPITTARGIVARSEYGKVIPTFHPSAVLRQWSNRTVVMADLLKAAHEATFPDVRRPQRELWVEPTLTEVSTFFTKHLFPAKEISLDIENPGGQLHCLALAPSPTIAICIPFIDPRKPDRNYWSYADECQVWRLIRRLLVDGTISKRYRTIGQNLLYDVQHLAKAGCKLASIDDDTMLAHHAMYPEMRKGLGFLGSIYTNELSWKQMHKDLGRDK